MAVDGASPFVQTVFTDQPGIGYPGQVYKPSYHSQAFTETFAAGNGPVFCGRMVVVGTAIDYTNNDTLYSSPYTIKLAEAATVAANLVGVVVRPISGAQNEVDVEDGKEKAGFGTKDKIPVLRLGSKVTIQVRQDEVLGAVAYGDPVYVATQNTASVAVGEFAKAAGTGLILVPNAIWYLTKTTTNALDPIGVIQLL